MLKYIFLIISDGGVACGCDLGRGQILLLFLSLADHMPEVFTVAFLQSFTIKITIKFIYSFYHNGD